MSDQSYPTATPEELANFRDAIEGKHGSDLQRRASQYCYGAFRQWIAEVSDVADADDTLQIMVRLAINSSAEFAARHCTEQWPPPAEVRDYHELMCLGAIRHACLAGQFN